MGHALYRRLAFAAAIPVLLAGATAAATVEIELNKLEPRADGCRAYLVFEHRGEHDYDGFTLDLVLFDNDGVISRRLAVDAAPLRAGKTTVKVFDLEGLDCDSIQRVLLNDLSACSVDGSPLPDCIDRVGTGSRAGAALVK
ncbi:MAG: hypothetical protein R3202_10790 [Candidatus Competibacterales bacterium]|nr:hypothetical protein [Candidatus Competibacterales bacterium]